MKKSLAKNVCDICGVQIAPESQVKQCGECFLLSHFEQQLIKNLRLLNNKIGVAIAGMVFTDFLLQANEALMNPRRKKAPEFKGDKK